MGIFRWIVVGVLTLIAIVTVGVGIAVHGQATGWLVPTRSLPTWVDALDVDKIVVRPQGEGPFPVLAIFSGCGGVRAHHPYWAQIAAEEGYLAVIVDSFKARGLNRAEARAKVCSGSRLWGRERAGDVAATLALIERLPDADPDRVVLMGQSHGAWAIMDLMAMDLKTQGPTGLSAIPDPALRSSVAGTILFYPYCGMMSLTGKAGWAHEPDSLMIIAEEDTVVSSLACLKAADHLKATGLDLTVKRFQDADHAFDQFDHDPTSSLVYRPELTEEVTGDVRGFLRMVRATEDDAADLGSF